MKKIILCLILVTILLLSCDSAENTEKEQLDYNYSVTCVSGGWIVLDIPHARTGYITFSEVLDVDTGEIYIIGDNLSCFYVAREGGWDE